MDTDIVNFLILCSADDRNFLDKPDSERSIEDYVRLSYISARLGFMRIFSRLIGEVKTQNRFDEFLAYAQELKGNKTYKERWMKEFVDNIEFEAYKKVIVELLQEEERNGN